MAIGCGTILRIGVFPDAKFSQINLEAEEAQRGKKLRDHWREQLRKFQSRVDQDADKKSPSDFHAVVEEAASYAYHEWMEFVRNEASLNQLIAALRGGWNCIGIDPVPTDAELQKWAEETAVNTSRAEVLKEYAIAAWKHDEREHAKQLFRSACELEAAGTDIRDILRQSTGVALLDDIRRALREDLEQHE